MAGKPALRSDAAGICHGVLSVVSWQPQGRTRYYRDAQGRLEEGELAGAISVTMPLR